MFLCRFWFAVCGKTLCIDKRAVVMQCNARLNGRGAKLGNAPKGTSPSLGVWQHSLICLLLQCFIGEAFFGKEMGDVVGFALCRVVCLAR